MDNKNVSILSLCQKAGFLKSGEFSCEKALQQKVAKLVIIASDASDNTKKKFVNKAFFYEVPSIVYGTKDELSSTIGKQNRATLIITDENFANMFTKELNNTNK